jgi:hypothetical protein
MPLAATRNGCVRGSIASPEKDREPSLPCFSRDAFKALAVHGFDWIADDSIREEEVVAMRRCGVKIVTREKAVGACTNEQLFLCAAARRQPLMTRTPCYKDLLRYDHTESWGVLLFSDPWHNSMLLPSAAAHLSAPLAQLMRARRGVTICYDDCGDYEVTMPKPEWPTRSSRIEAGKFPLGS